ncbi:tetratricopeptide repeat protein [Pseudemcibacter aquimaris]|uniref:tetratricopeptide repeat protein n=1 Tax=Pseudemcibacter aquimaris TaxID=2857064 RepID=UPI002011CF04|nr:tetratricopeptide repeat protein [Pseudemcibacter aquimaris]MCC3862126.1 tetratricopeptide repeat protein [Pseudemcibacter aquimaris]WDU58879.1 hypothetical protein KW060_01150 [Pseudemcibacter aquimaris]
MFTFVRNIFIFFGLLALSACSTNTFEYSYTASYSEQTLLDGYLILGKKLEDSDLPETDILTVTPEMEKFLTDELGKVNGDANKARKLSKAIFDEKSLGLIYDPKLTYTANEAFIKGYGNCLSFSYLYSVLARRLGLDIQFQEIHILPEWDYASDDIYVENKHVNIRVKVSGNPDLIVDIDEVLPERQLDYTLLSKNDVEALYYGNIGAEYLINNDFQTAFKYFVKAIKMDPDNSSYWANLGVLYRRAGYNKTAEKSYFKALSLNSQDKATLNNLSFMYRELGENEKADYFGNLVKKYQNKNPYFRYVKAKKAMEENLYDLAMDHINQAIKRKEQEPRFHELKSQIYARVGNLREAQKALRVAENLKSEAI